MVTLSLAMIAKNEEGTIERVLSNAKTFCDELIVVDTGSTDRTPELIDAMGATLHYFEWIDHFAAARNYAFDQAQGDWIMWLDADDTITDEDQQRFLELKQTSLNDDIDGVFISYQCAFDKEDRCTFSFPRERLIRRAAGLRWEYPVHECIALPWGRSITRLDINIQHRPLAAKVATKVGRNLKILEKALASGDRCDRNLFYYANELKENGFADKALEHYTEYLGVSKLHWEKYQAYLNMSQCCRTLDDEKGFLHWLCQAMLHDSTRAEAFVQLGIFYYHKEEWRKAVPFFQAALHTIKPDFGFVSTPDYTWAPHDYLAVCYSRLGEVQKAIDFTLTAFPQNPDKERLHKNLQYLIEHM